VPLNFARPLMREDYRLARLYHPDSSHPDASPSNFLTLNKAYKLLSSSQARHHYLRTGYGWSASHVDPSPHAEMDAMMRNEIHFRRRAAAGMHPRANASAWGGFRGDGKFDPYDDMENHGLGPNPPRWEGRGGPEGKGEERYMTNGRFLSWVGALVRGLLTTKHSTDHKSRASSLLGFSIIAWGKRHPRLV
jgi:curved DNA-binding protein CbpA